MPPGSQRIIKHAQIGLLNGWPDGTVQSDFSPDGYLGLCSRQI